MTCPRLLISIIAVVLGACALPASDAEGEAASALALVPAPSSLTIAPGQPTVSVGGLLALTATATYSDQSTQDVTTQVQWSTSSPIAFVTSSGLVFGLAEGKATIKAKLGIAIAAVVVKVQPVTLVGLDIAPGNPSVAAGTSQALTATAIYSDKSSQDVTGEVAWSTDDAAHVAIAADGTITGVAVGSATVHATAAGISGEALVTVTPATLVGVAVAPAALQIAKGHRHQLAAIGMFTDQSTADITAQVAWASSNAGVAVVSNDAATRGLVATVAQGDATVTASLDGYAATVAITVTPPVLDRIAILPGNLHVVPGAIPGFTAFAMFSDATSLEVTRQTAWSSSDPAVASISSAAPTQGRATAIAPGTTTIRADYNGATGSVPLVVDGLAVAITPGDGATNVPTTASIALVFNQAIAPASLTTQRRSGACTGSLQLSADGFATCLGFAFNGPVLTGGNAIATVAPASPLAPSTTYRARVLGSVTTAGGAPLGEAVSQTTGFTTAP